MNSNFLPIALSVLGFIILFVIISYLSKRKTYKILKKLSNSFKGYIPKSYFLIMPAFKGEYRGVNFTVVAMPADRNSPSYLYIYFFKSHFFKLSICRQSSLTKVGDKMGLYKKVITNDGIFDQQFHAVSDDAAQAANYLKKENIKNIIKDIFDLGFDKFGINKKRVMISKCNYAAEDAEPEKIKNILEKIYQLPTVV